MVQLINSVADDRSAPAAGRTQHAHTDMRAAYVVSIQNVSQSLPRQYPRP